VAFFKVKRRVSIQRRWVTMSDPADVPRLIGSLRKERRDCDSEARARMRLRVKVPAISFAATFALNRRYPLEILRLIRCNLRGTKQARIYGYHRCGHLLMYLVCTSTIYRDSDDPQVQVDADFNPAPSPMSAGPVARMDAWTSPSDTRVIRKVCYCSWVRGSIAVISLFKIASGSEGLLAGLGQSRWSSTCEGTSCAFHEISLVEAKAKGALIGS